MTHAEFLHQAVAEIAEELPDFEDLDPATRQSLRELVNITSTTSLCSSGGDRQHPPL